MTLGDYDKLYQSQFGRCANPHCERHDERTLSVDHDHKTDVIRGLLCSKCNLALGCVDDEPDILLGLVAYLIKHKSGGAR